MVAQSLAVRFGGITLIGRPAFLSPIMLIAALVIDYTVVTDYLKWVRNTFRRDAIAGVIIGILSVIGFPVLSGYFLARALLKKQVKKAKAEYERKRDGDLVEYEELETDFPPRVSVAAGCTRSTG